MLFPGDVVARRGLCANAGRRAADLAEIAKLIDEPLQGIAHVIVAHNCVP
jgi:hypothetical protein